MSEQPTGSYMHNPSGAGGSNVKIAILFGAVLALLAANVYLFLQVDHLRTDMGKQRDSLQTEISNLREASSVTAQTNRRTVESLRDELETARRQAAMAVGQAKTDAEAKVSEINKRIEAETKKAAQTAQAVGAIKSDLTEVRKEATETKEKVAAVNTEVGSVKGEVASTKSELEKTISELKSVRGDLGLQSGLIATNGKELALLIARGERNYFEFNLGKTKQPQKVGDIGLLLKRTDRKKNRYTLEVHADDKSTEKKDKSINEPVQFLTAKTGRVPYEIIVNEVKDNVIVGYLSTPKVAVAR